MFVGEIGLLRREYLYDLTFAELLLIKRGYFRRFHPQWEMARLIAHQVHYCMGLANNESPKTPSEWLPFSWEHTEDGETIAEPIPDEEEVERLRQIMRDENAKLEHAKKADQPSDQEE